MSILKKIENKPKTITNLHTCLSYSLLNLITCSSLYRFMSNPPLILYKNGYIMPNPSTPTYYATSLKTCVLPNFTQLTKLCPTSSTKNNPPYLKVHISSFLHTHLFQYASFFHKILYTPTIQKLFQQAYMHSLISIIEHGFHPIKSSNTFQK